MFICYRFFQVGFKYNDLIIAYIHSSHWFQKWYGEEYEDVATGNWNQPDDVPQCLLFHLEIFMWEGYEGLIEDEREIAKYILRNTNRLKRATFSITTYDENDSPDMVEVAEELESVVRASNSCQLVFECKLDVGFEPLIKPAKRGRFN